MEISEKYNVKGFHPPYVKDEDKCTGCGLCELICPEFAIFIRESEGEEMEEEVNT